MWTKTYSKTYNNISKESIWQAWTDVNNWPRWDSDLDKCQLDSSFEVGNHFYLKPKGGPNIKITLSKVIYCKQFTDYCRFPGATLHDDHVLEETAEGLKITGTITVRGPLSFLWSRLVARKIIAALPEQMDALVTYARSQ